jgi:hypothetical protein
MDLYLAAERRRPCQRHLAVAIGAGRKRVGAGDKRGLTGSTDWKQQEESNCPNEDGQQRKQPPCEEGKQRMQRCFTT